MKKTLRYMLAFLPSLAFLIYVGTILFRPGYIIYTDVTERMDVSSLYERYIYTYTDDVGESLSLAETQRIPLFYIIYSVFNLTGLDDSYFVKIKLFSIFVFSIAAFVFTTYKIIRKTFEDKEKYLLLLFSNLAGVYYVSNYWATNRIAHFFLFFASAAIPLFIYLLWSFLFSEKRDLSTLSYLLVVLTLFNATPHTFLFEFILGVILITSYIVWPRQKFREKLTRLIILIPFVLGYILLNSYWIAPYLKSLASPDKVLSKTIVETIAKNATLINNISLKGYWLANDYDYQPSIQALATIFKMVSFLPILIFGFVSLFLIKSKKRTQLTLLSAIFLTGLFLSTASKTTLNLYCYLMFDSPIKVLGWLFREIEKLGLLIAYVYSFSIALFLVWAGRKRKYLAAALVVVAMLMGTNLWYFNSVVRSNYTPQQIPNDFREVNNLLKEDNEEFNVVWYPGVETPSWAKTEEVRYVFTNLLSSKPAPTTNSDIQNFLTYLMNYENTYYINVGKALDLLGTKYLVLRKDGVPSLEESQLEDALDMQTSLEMVLETEYLKVYRNNVFSGISKIYKNRLITNSGYGALKKLDELNIDTSNTFLDYTDKPSGTAFGNVIYDIGTEDTVDLVINKFQNKFIFPWDYSNEVYDGDNSEWKKSSLEDKVHAESSYFFGFLGIFTHQMDYNKGVLSISDGLRVDSEAKDIKKFTPVFKEKRAKFDGENFSYEAVPEDLIFEWNSIQSEIFDIGDARAIRIKLGSDIKKELNPHFKIFFFDGNMGFTKSFSLYPDRKGNLENVVKVPDNSRYARFGVWTLSESPRVKKNYSYTVSDLEIEDVSNHIKPVDFPFRVNTQCTGRCHVFVRALKSPIGGQMQLDIDGNVLYMDSAQSDELPTKYSWVRLGQVEVTNEISNIKFTNIEGFNSINALVLLNDFEVVEMDRNAQSINIPEGTIIEDLPTYTKTTITRVNPTRYIIENESNSAPFILGFAKPYSKNWSVEGKSPILLNGLINGWEIRDPENQEIVIEFAPQKSFEKTTKVSVASAILLFAYISTKLVIASPRRSNSQG